MDIKYNRIKIILAEQGRSGKWLASKMNKNLTTVSKWCTNTIQPTIKTLFEIAETLNVKPSDLLND
jgi:transcriptional regulator with XRE-family HTH domain